MVTVGMELSQRANGHPLDADARTPEGGKAMSTYIRAVVAAMAIADKYGIPLGDLVDTFADIPAADVAPVRRGRWEFGKDLPDSFGSINKNKYHLYCSECRNQAFNKTVDNDPDFDVDTPFCPWCGAKMDKEE